MRKAIHVLSSKDMPAAVCQEGAVAVGNFDGVHRGHAALVEELREQAAKVRGPAVVVTFDPHPLQLLQPERFQPLLTTVGDRAELLLGQGADQVVVLRTTNELLHLSAQEFFQEIIVERLKARAIVEGPNFGFGRNREGNVDVLRRFCLESGIHLHIVTPIEIGGTIVASSRVRSALCRGAVRQATELCSRPYRLRGTVGVGQGRGRGLGFPTANLDKIDTLVPLDGVYAVRVYHGETIWPGAANIGPNPTFGEQNRKIEIHLIGFRGELVGHVIVVEFIDRLRDVRPFSGPAELVTQLQQDIDQAIRIVDSGQ